MDKDANQYKKCLDQLDSSIKNMKNVIKPEESIYLGTDVIPNSIVNQYQECTKER